MAPNVMAYKDFQAMIFANGAQVSNNRYNNSVRNVLQKELIERGVKNLINYVPNGELSYEYSFDARVHAVLGTGKGQIMVALRRAYPFGVYLINEFNADRMYTVLTDEVEYDWYSHNGFSCNVRGVKIEFKRLEEPHDGVKVEFTDKLGVKWEGISIAKF